MPLFKQASIQPRFKNYSYFHTLGIIEMFEDAGWIFETEWRPWWQRLLFGERKLLYGPVGTNYVILELPRTRDEAAMLILKYKLLAQER